MEWMESDSSTDDIKEVSKKVVVDLTVEDEKKPKKNDIQKKIEKEKKKLERRRRINMKYNNREQVKKYVEELGLDYNVFMKYYVIEPAPFFYVDDDKRERVLSYEIKMKKVQELSDYEKAEREVYNKELFGMSVGEMYRLNTIPSTRMIPRPITRPTTMPVRPPMMRPLGELLNAYDARIAAQRREEQQRKESLELARRITEAGRRSEREECEQKQLNNF